VRLITPLDSRNDSLGSLVEAMLTKPLFSKEGLLVFPVGSRVSGEVVNVKAARKLHRNGELSFRFTSIEAPAVRPEMPVAPQIEGRLASLQVARDMDDVRIDEKGRMRVVESKKRFIAPAYAAVKVVGAVDATPDSFGDALLGGYRSQVTKRLGGKEPGLSPGLAGSVTGAMIPPVGIGLAVFGAARSVYSNFIGRGQDIRFPVDTLMEIELD
jgi:hypothetical protein